MGVGRRMGKKQGIPASFEEFYGSKSDRKRKNGTPGLDHVPFKKQRTSDDRTVSEPRPTYKARENSKALPKKSTLKPSKILSSNGTVAANIGNILEFSDKESLEDDLEVLDGDEDDSPSLQDEFSIDGDSDEEEVDGSDNSDVVDSDNEVRNGMWSDEDEEDPEEAINAANIEGLSRHLDARAAQEAKEAQAELEEAAIQTNIAADVPPELSDDEEDGSRLRTRLAPDLQLLRSRITDTIRVLDDFAKYAAKEPSRSRADYTRQLLKDICAYYGYSMFLADKLFSLFPASEAFAFFEANETARPIVVRTNTLRTHRRELAQSLINRGVTLEPVGKWSKIGLQIFESAVPLGATPEYLAGHYIIQAASSFLPVMALGPQENERVLDMAAAPGGKTTHMAAMMKNTGCIFANDSNKDRAKALIGNIHRLGVKNTIVCNYDALEFPKVMGGFDRVLLDAPCSGTGVISKDASVKTNKTEKDFMRLPHLQKRLLLAAIDSVDHASKTGGYVVYSTCSVTVEENEQVVQYALNKRPNVKLVETGINFGKEGFTNYMGKKFSPSMKMTRRYYPHAYNVDGFFVSKFQKIAVTPANAILVAPNGTSTSNGEVNGKIGDDKTAHEPIVEPIAPNNEPFAEFDDEEDDEIIARAERKSMRKKGLNPKAIKGLREKKRASASSEDHAAKVTAVQTNGKKAVIRGSVAAEKASKPVAAPEPTASLNSVVTMKAKRSQK